MAINLDHTGAGEITLKSPSSGSGTLVLPASVGTADQVLTTDGSGNLSFVTPVAQPDEYARTIALLAL